MTRHYNIEGTKSYLIAAIILLLLAGWHAYDGWFPRPEVLAVHPRSTLVTAPVAGEVVWCGAQVGEIVRAEQPLFRMQEAGRSEEVPAAISLNDAMSAESKVKKAVVTELFAAEGDVLEQSAVMVKLKSKGDSYYLYNRVTAVILLVAGLVCAYIHKVVR